MGPEYAFSSYLKSVAYNRMSTSKTFCQHRTAFLLPFKAVKAFADLTILLLTNLSAMVKVDSFSYAYSAEEC